jgi:hypothetical protein
MEWSSRSRENEWAYLARARDRETAGLGVSGAINGDAALSIRAEKLAVDSRYARIMGIFKMRTPPSIVGWGD